uniref:Uncharacterized protein n=1 Tax=Strigamia maritima TaxID=126957 RepID=T1JDE7_STRMM
MTARMRNIALCATAAMTALHNYACVEQQPASRGKRQFRSKLKPKYKCLKDIKKGNTQFDGSRLWDGDLTMCSYIYWDVLRVKKHSKITIHL